jgi:predicted ABC-type transport system involved in lysophospholipase L1 biosynthesis ATPase subunit
VIDREEQIKFVAKLIQLTLAKKAVWTSTVRSGREALRDMMLGQRLEHYETTIEGQKLQLSVRAAMRSSSEPMGDDPSVTLDLLDTGGSVIWTISELSALRDLLQAVTRQPNTVRDAIDRIMKVNI